MKNNYRHEEVHSSTAVKKIASIAAGMMATNPGPSNINCHHGKSLQRWSEKLYSEAILEISS